MINFAIRVISSLADATSALDGFANADQFPSAKNCETKEKRLLERSGLDEAGTESS
jgi:hypothetical protein